MSHFEHLDYLQYGNERQRAAYRVLKRHRVFEKLVGYGPLLAGTFPIGIDIEGSDLDILCHAPDSVAFAERLKGSFGREEGFTLRVLQIRGEDSVVANFQLDGFPVEVFGQGRPANQQMAYRHMLIEHRLLQERGLHFRLAVIRLKQQGYKTEPAFAEILGLSGDPYLALLELE